MAIKPARLLILGIAFAAAAGAYMLSRPSQVEVAAAVVAAPAPPVVPMDKVLVARSDLPMGMQLGPADMVWQEWPVSGISPNMIRQSVAAGLREEIAGSIVRSAFLSGEPMRRDKLVKGNNSGFLSALLAPGRRAVAINIDPQGSNSAGGFILSNDHVDILNTYRDEDAAKAGSDGLVTEVILRDIRVLAIGQNVQEKNGQTVMSGTTATLELDEEQAQKVIRAQRTSATGNLTLILRPMLETSETKIPQEQAINEAGPLTLVRYGVASQVSRK